MARTMPPFHSQRFRLLRMLASKHTAKWSHYQPGMCPYLFIVRDKTGHWRASRSEDSFRPTIYRVKFGHMQHLMPEFVNKTFATEFEAIQYVIDAFATYDVAGVHLLRQNYVAPEWNSESKPEFLQKYVPISTIV